MKNTEVYNWPYAEPGDDPRNFPAFIDRPRTIAIENSLIALNTSVNAANGDTGWIKVNGTGNWLANSDINIRKTGRNDVYINAKFQAPGTISNNTHNGLAFLPANYRPTRDLTFSAALRRTDQAIEYWPSVIVRIIASTGEIIAYTEHAGAAIFLTASWPR